MGYNTDFEGELKFAGELDETELAYLREILAKGGDHDDYDASFGGEDGYFNLKVTGDGHGIGWNYTEKPYGMVDQVNAVVKWMRTLKPDFGLTGEMQAQGEDVRDRWVLRIVDGVAVKQALEIEGSIYLCPNCGHQVVTSEAEKVQ